MTIAVDFDGTIVTHEYPKIGKPIPFAIETLKKLQTEQHLIILWTVREGALLEEAVEYCKSKGLEFYAVNSNYPEQLEDYIPKSELEKLATKSDLEGYVKTVDAIYFLTKDDLDGYAKIEDIPTIESISTQEIQDLF